MYSRGLDCMGKKISLQQRGICKVQIPFQARVDNIKINARVKHLKWIYRDPGEEKGVRSLFKREVGFLRRIGQIKDTI